MADALWYWHRFRAMSVVEVWHRVVEKAKHIAEPFVLGASKHVRLTQEPADCPSLPSREAAPALLKQTLAGDAAKLLDGKWSLFGWKEVQVSSSPDWHCDYMCGVSVPVSGKLNHRSLPDGADVRAIWEINRWAEPVRLAMHGWLNDDVEAIVRAQSWLADWVEKNPVGRGINWTSALEGGLRLINFCWFDALALQMGLMQGTLRDAVVPAHVWWVRRHLSYGSSANNHRLGELTGLLLAVKRWPEMEPLAGTAENLWEQVAECVLAQFAEDGGNREQALHYHLFAFVMALHACRAMNVVDGPVTERLQRAAEFFVRMSHPQEPWDYGDNDDAQIVPMTTDREKAVAEWCAWMSGCGTGLQPVCPSGILPDDACTSLRYWLGELFAKRADDECGQHARNTHRSETCATWWIAKESGMAVIERDGWKVRVDASPLGFGKMAAHGHCDALHVSIWDGEHALVIDPGTGGYFASKELRAELASWNAHNGPQPSGGFKTPKRMGTFLWNGTHALPKTCFSDDDIRILFEHEALAVTRGIHLLDEDFLGIRDYAEARRPIEARWCLAPECNAEILDKKNVSISRGTKRWRLTVESDLAQIELRTIKSSRAFCSTENCTVIQVSGPGEMSVGWRRLK